VGLRIAYGFSTETSRVECFAGVRNLFGERFADNLRSNAFGGRYFEAAPARHVYAGLRVSGL
jgi:iron complex outermembrane receptor protein